MIGIIKWWYREEFLFKEKLFRSRSIPILFINPHNTLLIIFDPSTVPLILPTIRHLVLCPLCLSLFYFSFAISFRIFDDCIVFPHTILGILCYNWYYYKQSARFSLFIISSFLFLLSVFSSLFLITSYDAQECDYNIFRQNFIRTIKSE